MAVARAHDQSPHRAPDTFSLAYRVSFAAVGQQRGELLSADAGHDGRCVQVFAQRLGAGADRLVAGSMAVAIIDQLEMIDVEQDDREWLRRAVCEPFGDDGLERPTVQKSGQRVVRRVVSELRGAAL